jgi:hypothetical protein
MTDNVDPINRHRLATVQRHFESELAQVRDLPCDTPEQEQWWGDLGTRAQAAIKELEEERVLTTKPINEDLRRINGEYRTAAALAEAVKALVKLKLEDAANARLAAQEATRALAASAAAAGDSAGCSEALAAIPDDVRSAGVRTPFVWSWLLWDITKVPSTYVQPDDKALNRLCRATPTDGDPPSVPGIAFKKVARAAMNGSRK